MQLHVLQGDWGEARLNDIEKVLGSVDISS